MPPLPGGHQRGGGAFQVGARQPLNLLCRTLLHQPEQLKVLFHGVAIEIVHGKGHAPI